MQKHLAATAFVATILMFGALPLRAQQTDDIQRLEQKLDELLRQAAEIRSQLDAMKGGQPPVEEDLTRVEEIAPSGGQAILPVQPPQEATPADQPATALTDVQPVENQIAPGASKVFNPDTSVIGTFLAHAGQANEFESEEPRSPLALDEVEVSFQAFVDPYARAKFFLGISEEGIEVEEGYAEFLTLPYELNAKAGRMKARFGKANTWHTHVRPWADQPLVIQNFFGGEGLIDSGVSVSRIFPTASFYTEATAEVLSGDAEGVFERESRNDLFYNAHLRFYDDISENSNVEVGTSLARGTLPEAGGKSTFGGIDVTYRWKPLQQGLYRSFIGRAEVMANDRDDLDDRLFGFYVSGDLQFARRWFAGVRLDRADRDVFTDKGVSATLTFWPSEFSQLRGQLRRTSYGGARTVTEVLLQLQFAIGAHGAHTF